MLDQWMLMDDEQRKKMILAAIEDKPKWITSICESIVTELKVTDSREREEAVETIRQKVRKILDEMFEEGIVARKIGEITQIGKAGYKYHRRSVLYEKVRTKENTRINISGESGTKPTSQPIGEWVGIDEKIDTPGFKRNVIHTILEHSYLESKGSDENIFDPGFDLGMKNVMRRLGLWHVMKCVEHPKSDHRTSKCHLDIAFLTPLGLKAGRELIRKRLDEADSQYVKDILTMLPYRVRSLFLNLLLGDNELQHKPWQLEQLDGQETLKQLNGQGLSGIPDVYMLLFPCFEKAQIFGKHMANLGLGSNDAQHHVVNDWKPYLSFVTSPEVCKYLSERCDFDRYFLKNLVQALRKPLSPYLAKLHLLGVMKEKKSVSQSDLSDTEFRYIGTSSVVLEFVEELKQKHYLSNEEPMFVLKDLSQENTLVIEEIRRKMSGW